ncbi:peptidoglycan DD-metalloendopeptidase family protein [Legionella impletisoli]|uniref:Lipoprotein NlpD n=1 Tax=Legionella impletisoli TaxID=343510 RepID=A0A917JQT9_9GAMM|nr:peptidoglycan DD-metalloendopeptidase family protein [Legionella impletisoli]GGI80589.1 lipoprotein NlpD [Legionella impletisoli]
MRQRFVLFLLISLIAACSQREGLAPVSESNWRAPRLHQTSHIVAPGETLYAIAFRYDQDYLRLAEINHLHSPYRLRVGQVIHLKPTSKSLVKKPVYTQRKSKWLPAPKPEPRITSFNGRWQWPVNGRIVNHYAPARGKKGIDIAGRTGESVRAASGGVVAYSGNGLIGYGNLIIIKHDNQFLTAYGNNAQNFVKEGQQVKAGQVIAKMGLVDHKYWGLHFEIRKSGKPVNPLNYLKKG